MSTQAIAAPSATFRIAWLTLLGIAALATVSHAALSFVMPGEETLFIGWAAFIAYATAVLLFPFRRGERWAWYATWILVLGFASLIFFDAAIGVWYLGGAGVLAGCLILTRGVFFANR
jgi:hypothetical protein